MNNKWVNGKYTPKFPQKYKGDASKITFRSSWELSAMKFFDFTPEILQWQSEETIIMYNDPTTLDEFGRPKPRRYFMDFLAVVRKADGSIKTILIEIKPYKQTIRPRRIASKSEKTMDDEYKTWMKNQAKWAAAKELCRQKNWEFVVITERVLFAGIDKGFKAKKKPTRRPASF